MIPIFVANDFMINLINIYCTEMHWNVHFISWVHSTMKSTKMGINEYWWNHKNYIYTIYYFLRWLKLTDNSCCTSRRWKGNNSYIYIPLLSPTSTTTIFCLVVETYNVANTMILSWFSFFIIYYFDLKGNRVLQCKINCQWFFIFYFFCFIKHAHEHPLQRISFSWLLYYLAREMFW